MNGIVYKIVLYHKEVGLLVHTTIGENIRAWCEIRGFTICGVNANPRQREELQGHPIISGLCGPMYDGPGVIRYEDSEANERLSI
jgi:hypothetical protein